MDKNRLLTGFVLAGLVIYIILGLSTALFALISLVIILLAASEWAALLDWRSFFSQGLFLLGIIFLAGLSWYSLKLQMAWLPIAMAAGWWVGVLLMLSIYRLREWLSHESWFLISSAFPSLIPAWFALVLIHRYDPWLLFYLVVLASLGDTAAYFVGKQFGRHKLAPRLSPGKTWEGLVGEMVAALIVAIIGALIWGGGHLLFMFAFIGLSLLTVLASVGGDLFESFLKRAVGAKDSGRLLPGHGGVLDRIDSHLVAAPLFLLGLAGLFGGRVL